MRWFLLPLCWLACTPTPEEATRFPLQDHFPHHGWLHTGQVAAPHDLPYGETPWQDGRWAFREGFSPVQTAVYFPETALDASTLPSKGSMAPGDSVQLWDLTAQTRVPALVELDAWPEPEAAPTLIVRPMIPAPDGHHLALAFTDGLRTTDGDALPEAPWLTAVLDGAALEDAWPDATAHLDNVHTQLGALVDGPIVHLQDWRVHDPTAPLRSAFAGRGTPSLVDLTPRQGELPRTFAQFTGTFEATNYLSDNGQWVLDDDGLPIPQGTLSADLLVHVPASVEGAAPGTVPLWVFGHGIFASPGIYLSDEDDPSHVLELADRAGAIVVATTWRGLTTTDIGIPFDVASDIGTFAYLTDHLAQGVTNTGSLLDLALEGDLLDQAGVAELIDPETIRWYGISLGGIEGAVYTARDGRSDHAVFHVGGGAWSTLLERSQHWSTFESLLENDLPSERDRQLAYAISQLYWDPVDPANYAGDLSQRSVHWQIALGDDQVSNFASWIVVRGAGGWLLDPAPERPPLLATAPSAEPTWGPSATLYDPAQGTSDGSNRPADDTTSHDTPRTWEGTTQQTLAFLDRDDPGVVISPCGDQVCAPGLPLTEP